MSEGCYCSGCYDNDEVLWYHQESLIRSNDFAERVRGQTWRFFLPVLAAWMICSADGPTPGSC